MIKLAILKPISFAIFRECVQSIFLIFFLSIFILLLIYLAPGNYLLNEYMISLQEEVLYEANSNQEVKENLNFIESYLLWFQFAIQGNLGISSGNGLPVLSQVIEYTINSSLIIISALCLSLSISLPIAYFSVKTEVHHINNTILLGLNILSTFPIFWLSYIFIYLSGEWFDYFPLAADFEEISFVQFFLPVLLLSLGSGVLIEMISLIKSELRRVLQEEYILYARAKGASVFFHALKEGIIYPILNLLSNRVAYLFGATIIVEQIFNWPGIGRILWRSAQDRDIALLLAAVLISAIVIRVSYIITRTIYIIINPRASHE